MKFAEKFHKKMKKQLEENTKDKEKKKTAPTKQTLPAWFSKEQEVEEEK